MSTLHVVNKSPYERNTLETCVGYYLAGDTLLLIEDGVYAAVAAGQASAHLAGLAVAVLEPDLKARGIAADKLIPDAKQVGYADFVDLVTTTERVQSWL